MGNYYVYVYIDPRNFEEFYFGKGKGSRKNAHLYDESDSKKARRVKAIKEAGLDPIIRVVARNLTEHDALLVEKTLLWKLGRHLTNVSPGHYSDNFRPHDTLHQELSGFDFENGVYYYNIGEGPNRNWDDYKKFGFISAGGAHFRDAIVQFRSGDVIAAYLKGHGYVGIGQIKEPAKPINEVKIQGKPILSLPLCCPGMGTNMSEEHCEYVCIVEWKRTVERTEAKWKARCGLYTTTHVRASLDGQPKTIRFLEDEFGISLNALLM